MLIKIVTTCFKKGKCVSLCKGKNGIFDNLEKKVRMGWMDDICVWIAILEARTFVVE